MKERPIIFSAPMVRAILEGRKTQTRRTIRRGQVFRILPGSELNVTERRAVNAEPFHWERESPAHPTLEQLLTCCPYGVAGDRLWVRETWCFAADPITSRTTDRVLYRATDRCDFMDDGDGYAALNKDGSEKSPWRPSIHMPRSASRLTLEVVAVRVERLSAITEEDAKAEGVERLFTAQECASTAGIEHTKPDDHGFKNYLWHGEIGRSITAKQSDAWRHQFSSYRDARGSFSSLWESINGAGSWALDPWVWVVEFRRVGAAP